MGRRLHDGGMLAEKSGSEKGVVFTTAVSSDFPTVQARKFKYLFTSDPPKIASSAGQLAKTG